MIGKIMKYAIVVGATAAATLYGAQSCNKAAYSGLKPAEGFPPWERAKNISIEYVERDRKLETYVEDGSDRIPVHERDGQLLIGGPEECALYTLKERVTCITAYEGGNGNQLGGNEQGGKKGFGFRLGKKLREGNKALDEVVDDIKEGYKR